jgi:hypothetical protein
VKDKIPGLHFADYTVLLANDETHLNEMLFKIENWMAENDMEINADKCAIININQNNKNELKEHIKYINKDIKVVN